ncbi:putative reverse transcriptase domain-containing protein [Tanacetum coccineum]
MPGRPPMNRKKDKSEMKNQKHVARPPRSMTCKNCGETGHNKNDCEKPKVPGEQANPPNEQPNRASQHGNPPSQQGPVPRGQQGRDASGSNREGEVLVVFKQGRGKNVIAGECDQDENQDEAARLKMNCEDYVNLKTRQGERSLEEQDEAARLKGRI